MLLLQLLSVRAQHLYNSALPGIDSLELNLARLHLLLMSDQSSLTLLIIVTLPLCAENPELDMGSHFDYFGPESWSDCTAITPQQCANRMLLRELMMRHGFMPFEKEWWHFTLENEPFPDSYFNFPVM